MMMLVNLDQSQEGSSEAQEELAAPSDEVAQPSAEKTSTGVPGVQIPSAPSGLPTASGSSDLPEPPRSPSPPPDTESLQPAEGKLSANTCPVKYLFTEVQVAQLADFYRENELFYNKKINSHNAGKKKRLLSGDGSVADPTMYL